MFPSNISSAPKNEISEFFLKVSDSKEVPSMLTQSNESDVRSVKCNGKNTSVEDLKKIIVLIEYYLSDENLVKDLFLLKHVTKHNDGYISLKLMTNYKRIKRFTKDSLSVANALMDSKFLEVSEDKTKVRRRIPLPPEVENDTKLFRTLFAYNIPTELATIAKLTDIFSKFGDMNALRVLKPNGKDFYELKRCTPDLTVSHCALIEYDKVHCARQALKLLSNNSEYNFNIAEFQRNIATRYMCNNLGIDNESCYCSASEIDEPFSPMILRKSTKMLSPSPSSGYSSPLNFDFTTTCDLEKLRCSTPVTHRHRAQFNNLMNSSCMCSTPRDNLFFLGSQQYEDYSDYGSRGTVSYSSSNTSPRDSRNSSTSNWLDSPRLGQNRHHLDVKTPPSSPFLKRSTSPSSNPSSPWVNRRRNRPTMNESKCIPDNIHRFPKGPDGTKGFNQQRS